MAPSRRKTQPIRTHRSGALRIAASRLGERLRALREQRGLTIERAAELSDLNAVHLWKLEQGHLNVTLSTLTKIASGFDVRVEDLFLSRTKSIVTRGSGRR